MAIDVKAKAVNDASHKIVSAGRELDRLSGKIITPLVKGKAEDGSQDILISAATITALKGEFGAAKTEYETARTAMDAALAL